MTQPEVHMRVLVRASIIVPILSTGNTQGVQGPLRPSSSSESRPKLEVHNWHPDVHIIVPIAHKKYPRSASHLRRVPAKARGLYRKRSSWCAHWLFPWSASPESICLGAPIITPIDHTKYLRSAGTFTTSSVPAKTAQSRKWTCAYYYAH